MTNDNRPTPLEDPHADAPRDAGQEQVDAAVAEESAAGFRGFNTDETPDHNYTLQGVVEGAPTPETTRVVNRRMSQAPGLAVPLAGAPAPGQEQGRAVTE